MINKSDIEEVLQKEVKEVISSSLSLKLLKIYSILYLGGAQPRWCERSQTNYYNQIALNGYQKLNEMKEILERTCELKKDIMIYVSSLAMHITSANITDGIACEGLTKGFLKESQFIKLPDCWVNRDNKVVEPIDDKLDQDEQIIEPIKQRGRPSNK